MGASPLHADFWPGAIIGWVIDDFESSLDQSYEVKKLPFSSPVAVTGCISLTAVVG
jgi:hypothetical protein